MPTYEYACKACGEHIDVRQSVNDEPLSVCPSCGGPLRKVFGSIGIAFKGSGFYRTDSRVPSKKAKASEGGSSSDGGKDSKKESASSDGASKSESKGEAKPKADSAKPASSPKSDAKSA
jgi:putative FmdB family regulatory protein